MPSVRVVVSATRSGTRVANLNRPATQRAAKNPAANKRLMNIRRPGAVFVRKGKGRGLRQSILDRVFITVRRAVTMAISETTTGNALETTAWMAALNYKSLRLVTAAYHMPRSLLEFHHAMSGMTLVPHPVFPENVKQARWWAWPGTASLMIGEYNKYLLALSRHWIDRLLEKTEPRTGLGPPVLIRQA